MRLARFKKQPSNWECNPCLEYACKKGAARGRLCEAHGLALLEQTNALLAGVNGATVDQVGATDDGYVTARVAGTHRTTGVHRLVMEGTLGRRLVEGENVHHRNGVRFDNRPQNLEVWVVSQPYGQRAADLVAHVREILARYDLTVQEIAS